MYMSRILLAEDGDDHARILTSVLKQNGFEVTRVSNGYEAYDALKATGPYDLLITDVMMPGMSGFELLAKLSEEGPLPPTIVLTSKQREEDVLRGLNYGALDYITKPFSPTIVIARVKRALAYKKE